MLSVWKKEGRCRSAANTKLERRNQGGAEWKALEGRRRKPSKDPGTTSPDGLGGEKRKK